MIDDDAESWEETMNLIQQRFCVKYMNVEGGTGVCYKEYFACEHWIRASCDSWENIRALLERGYAVYRNKKKEVFYLA